MDNYITLPLTLLTALLLIPDRWQSCWRQHRGMLWQRPDQQELIAMPALIALAPVPEQHSLVSRETPLQRHPRSLLVVAAVLIGATWITVGLRTWTRAKLIRTFDWDDITMLIANVFYTVFATAAIVDVDLALSPGFKAFKPSVLSAAVEFLLTAECFYILTIIFFKISLGLFFVRIVKSFWQRYVVYAAVILSTVFSVVYFFFAIFQCGVPKSGLDFALKKLTMQCVDTRVISGMGYAHAAIVSASDWTFVILPIPLLRESRMPIREKLVVGLILALAIAGSVCSLVRMKYLDQIGATFLNFFDFALWSVLEPGIGIIANCLATLRPLLRSVFSVVTPHPSADCSAADSNTQDPWECSRKSSIFSLLSTPRASSNIPGPRSRKSSVFSLPPIPHAQPLRSDFLMPDLWMDERC